MDYPDEQAIALSIVIVSYKSRFDLQRCLPTIQAQLVSFRFEIIIVDNYVQDDLTDWLIANYPSVRLINNTSNDGYAGGNNMGLKHTLGQFVLFLNPDTELCSNALERLVTTARQFPNALITPKLLNPDGTINACGNEMHYTGITTCRLLNEPASSCTYCHTVPLLSGAALLGANTTFQQMGGFDSSYFMYFEDTDLSLRARLLGHPLLCEARAVITHHYKLGMNETKFYYLERNRLQTYLKLFSGSTLLRLLPALLVTELLTWGYSLRGRGYLRARLRTYSWLWTHRKSIRRPFAQPPGDLTLLDDALVSLPFSQVAGGTAGNLLNVTTRWLYTLLRPRSVRIETA